MSLEAVIVESIIDLVKILLALLLVIEYLYNSLAVHHFLNESFGSAERRLLTHEEFCAAAAYLARNEHYGDNSADDNERHPQAEPQHYEQHRDNHHSRLEQGWYRLRNELAKGVNIVCVTAHDIAVLFPVKISQGQALHLFKHCASHFIEEALCYICADLSESDR